MHNFQITFTVGLTTRAGTFLPAKSVIRTTAKFFAIHGIDGFSVAEKFGYWEGEPEDCLEFSTIVGSGHGLLDAIEDFAVAMAQEFDQTCVLWTCSVIDSGFGYSHAGGAK